MAVVIQQHHDRIAAYIHPATSRSDPAYIKRKLGADVSLADVVALAEITAQSLQSVFETMDSTVHRELREIADYIEAMKAEIAGSISTSSSAPACPPPARNSTLLAGDAGDPSFKALVDEKMLIVFEACSFQDITGQRVAKVIETLKHIEARVARFSDALRVRDTDGFVSEEERASAERKERLILHGPQLDDGDRQDEIDRLLAKL